MFIYKCLHISIGSILLLIVIAIGGANKIKRVNFAHLGDEFKKKTMGLLAKMIWQTSPLVIESGGLEIHDFYMTIFF
jgi:hypothetical protein